MHVCDIRELVIDAYGGNLWHRHDIPEDVMTVVVVCVKMLCL